MEEGLVEEDEAITMEDPIGGDLLVEEEVATGEAEAGVEEALAEGDPSVDLGEALLAVAALAEAGSSQPTLIISLISFLFPYHFHQW